MADRDRDRRREREKSRDRDLRDHRDRDRDRDRDRGRARDRDHRKRSRSIDRRKHGRSRTRSPDRGSRSPDRRDRHHRRSSSPDPHHRRKRNKGESGGEDEKMLQRGAKESKKEHAASGEPAAGDEGVNVDMDPDELEMMKKMGIPLGFDSTKGKPVPGADVSGIRAVTKRQPRQYMNRRGGFNRPLPPERNR